MTSRSWVREGVKGNVTTEIFALVINSVTIGEGDVKNCQKLRNVIYGRSLLKMKVLHESFLFRSRHAEKLGEKMFSV